MMASERARGERIQRWRENQARESNRFGDALDRIFERSEKRVALALAASEARLRSRQRSVFVDRDTVVMRGRVQASGSLLKQGMVNVDDRID